MKHIEIEYDPVNNVVYIIELNKDGFWIETDCFADNELSGSTPRDFAIGYAESLNSQPNTSAVLRETLT